jgi:translation initiation factor 5
VSTKGDKYLVNGKYEEKELAELLDKFIKKYVLCPDCGNPETNMVCAACRTGPLFSPLVVRFFP